MPSIHQALLSMAEASHQGTMAVLDAMKDVQDAEARTVPAIDPALMHAQIDGASIELQSIDTRIKLLHRLVVALETALKARTTAKAPGCPALVMTAGALADAYQEDASAADARYEGRQALVSGVVTRIGVIQGGIPYVVMGDGGVAPGRFWAESDTRATGSKGWERLHVGDTIRVACMLDGSDRQRPGGIGCALASP